MALEFWHPGIIVKDLEKAMRYYSNILGVGPFNVKVVDSDCLFRGKPVHLSLKVAQAKMGPVEIELIQGDPGDNPFWEFLQAHGEGLHHLAYKVKDIEAEIKEFEKKGVKVLIKGNTTSEKTFCYLESDPPSGTVIQLAQPR